MARVRLQAACAFVLVTGILVLAVAPARAASPCAKKVLTDWSDNSRVDGTYPLHCYGEAIDAIPVDIRPYSNAEDAIRQALLARGGRLPAVHEQGPDAPVAPVVAPTSAASSPSAVPIPLLVLGGVSLALLAAGGIGWVSRRRRDDGTDAADG